MSLESIRDKNRLSSNEKNLEVSMDMKFPSIQHEVPRNKEDINFIGNIEEAPNESFEKFLEDLNKNS